MSHQVTVRPIRTEEDFDAAMARLGEILHAPDGSPEADELDVLFALTKEYERANHPLPPSNPVEAVRFTMERKGLQAKDLVPYFGSQPRVSDFLNGKRGLSLEQVRVLHSALGIPLESLIGDPETLRPSAGTPIGVAIDSVTKGKVALGILREGEEVLLTLTYPDGGVVRFPIPAGEFPLGRNQRVTYTREGDGFNASMVSDPRRQSYVLRMTGSDGQVREISMPDHFIESGLALLGIGSLDEDGHYRRNG